MHIHAAPDTVPMRLDVVEAAQQARDAGMKAIVIKNHFYSTAPLVTIAKKFVPDMATSLFQVGSSWRKVIDLLDFIREIVFFG